MPRLSAWKKPEYPLWVRRGIKREEKKIIWLVSVIAFCDFAQRGFDPSRLPDNLFWYYLWAVTLLAYMFSRGLRYFTSTYDGIH